MSITSDRGQEERSSGHAEAPPRKPLYAMISLDGGHYTMVFAPDAMTTHSELSGSNRDMLGNFAGSHAPVIDLRTVRTNRSFSSGVREEYGDGSYGFSTDRPTLDEFCADVTAAGGSVWPLSSENFRHFSKEGLSPGVTHRMVDEAAEKRMQLIFARTQLRPAMTASDEIKGEGLAFGKAGVSPAAFLDEYLREERQQAARLAGLESILSGYADPEENQIHEMRLAEASAIEDLVSSAAPVAFEAAFCASMAQRFDVNAAIMMGDAQRREGSFEIFASALGAPSTIAKDELTPAFIARRSALAGLHNAATSAFHEHLFTSHHIRTTDTVECSALSEALRAREQWLDFHLTVAPAEVQKPEISAATIDDEPPSMDAFELTPGRAAAVSEIAKLAAAHLRTRDSELDR